MYTTPNLGLKVWDSDSDSFDRQDLIDNWEAIDDDYARQRSANQVELLASVPGTGNFDGRLVYLTAASGGFAAKTIIRYNGSSWAAVGPTPEVFSSLPTSGNFQGRVVVLTAASGGFSANDVVVNTNGATNWKKVGGVGTGTVLPGSPVAGDLFLLTASDGGFDAWSLVVYTGSAWIRTERRGVETGTTLPVAPYPGQMFVLTASAGGFSAYDVVRWNGSAWGKVNGSSSYVTGTWPVSPADGDLIMVPWGTQVAQFRYNAGSVSSYKWEHVGAGPVVWIGGINSTYTVPKSGEYLVHYQNNYGGIAQNSGNRVYVTNQSSGGAKVAFNVDNGNYSSQTTGITVSHYSTGGIIWPVTVTATHVLRLDGNYDAPYGAMEANLSGWAMQPVRVAA